LGQRPCPYFPHGSLEKHFLPGNDKKSFQLLCFEAIGLHLAVESIDDLKVTRFHDRPNRFLITADTLAKTK